MLSPTSLPVIGSRVDYRLSALSRVLCHCIQSASVLEPFDLRGIESMQKLHREGLSVLGVNNHRQRFINFKLSAENVHLLA